MSTIRSEALDLIDPLRSDALALTHANATLTFVRTRIWITRWLCRGEWISLISSRACNLWSILENALMNKYIERNQSYNQENWLNFINYAIIRPRGISNHILNIKFRFRDVTKVLILIKQRKNNFLVTPLMLKVKFWSK